MPDGSQPQISVTVKLFAAYQDAYGCDELVLQLEANSTAMELCDRLIQARPELERWRSITRFGINLEFAPPETLLQDGDEIVLIPPVSGG